LPQWHGDLHKRKKSGGKRHPYRGKRRFEMGSDPTRTIVGEQKVVAERVRAGEPKLRVLKAKFANVTDSGSGKSQKVEIKGVAKNPSNIDYERRGVITKGAIIETQLGKARVTSRPGRDGVVNAVLVERAAG